MKNRIREIRNALSLSQTAFGNAIGITGSAVCTYENGSRYPSDAVILSICREFGVSETWLRTGEGQMIIARTRDERIAFEVGRLLSDESAEFKRALIGALLAMDEAGWNLIENLVREIVNGEKKEG